VSAVMKRASRAASLEDMQIRKNFIAPLLLAAGVATAIAAAPTAMAANAPAQPCTNGVCPNSDTTLAGPLPGNTQINDSLPVTFAPQYSYYEGRYGGYSHGGFSGSGRNDGHR
jgi:hypothetical protein